MGPHGLAENLGISRGEATEIIGRYFSKFARVKNYMNDVVEVAKKQGFVETVFGRRRYAPELKSKNANIRNFGERAVINAPMQGTASDIVKKAMIDIFEITPKKMPEAKMILQVHDELIFEVPKAETKEYEKEICRAMEEVVKLKVPLKVNISSGPSWFDAH
jgi:DNA polymerase-1